MTDEVKKVGRPRNNPQPSISRGLEVSGEKKGLLDDPSIKKALDDKLVITTANLDKMIKDAIIADRLIDHDSSENKVSNYISETFIKNKEFAKRLFFYNIPKNCLKYIRDADNELTTAREIWQLIRNRIKQEHGDQTNKR